MIKQLICAAGLAAALITAPLHAAQYIIDPTHTFVTFKIQHLGTSWMHGGFNTVSGDMDYDADNANAASINIEIDTASVDTNHAERDKHIRSGDFLDVNKYPTATFASTGFLATESGAMISGDLTIRGVTKPVSFAVTKIGEGTDPWGGYRVGFTGTMNLIRADFGGNYNLGPASASMELTLSIEAIRK